MCAQAAATLDIPTVYDILIHMMPGMDDSAMHQSWCGADTLHAQKGALSSRERRKRKHKEVTNISTLSAILVAMLVAALTGQQMQYLASCAVWCSLLGAIHVAPQVEHVILLLSVGERA